MKKEQLSQIMRTAWRFFKITGLNFAECLKLAWANFKLVSQMKLGIVKFYFQKVDGSKREAWGTLKAELLPTTKESDKRAKNDTTQVYFDTEKQEYRCFKKLNLVY